MFVGTATKFEHTIQEPRIDLRAHRTFAHAGGGLGSSVPGQPVARLPVQSLTQHVIGIVIVSVAVFAAITSATLLSWLLMPCHRRMLYRYHDRAVVNVALVPCLACGRIDCMYLLVPAWPCLALLAYALTALTSCRARFYSLGKAQLRMLIHGTWAMNGLRP